MADCGSKCSLLTVTCQLPKGHALPHVHEDEQGRTEWEPRVIPPAYVPPVAPEWATYIEDRRPQFKVHNGLGQARNAVRIVFGSTGMRGGIIYRLNDGEWVESERVEPGTMPRRKPRRW